MALELRSTAASGQRFGGKPGSGQRPAVPAGSVPAGGGRRPVCQRSVGRPARGRGTPSPRQLPRLTRDGRLAAEGVPATPVPRDGERRLHRPSRGPTRRSRSPGHHPAAGGPTRGIPAARPSRPECPARVAWPSPGWCSPSCRPSRYGGGLGASVERRQGAGFGYAAYVVVAISPSSRSSGRRSAGRCCRSCSGASFLSLAGLLFDVLSLPLSPPSRRPSRRAFSWGTTAGDVAGAIPDHLAHRRAPDHWPGWLGQAAACIPARCWWPGAGGGSPGRRVDGQDCRNHSSAGNFLSRTYPFPFRRRRARLARGDRPLCALDLAYPLGRRRPCCSAGPVTALLLLRQIITGA